MFYLSWLHHSKSEEFQIQNPRVNKEDSVENVNKEEGAENAAHLKSLREAIVSTFKQQMRLRRRLMELDSHLLGLALDAERQHAAISHWEARFNRLYKPINLPGSRLSTQQSYRLVYSPLPAFHSVFHLKWKLRFIIVKLIVNT